MNFIKNILLFPYTIIKIMWKGFYFLLSQTTLGFYSYFVYFFTFLKHIFKKSTLFSRFVTHFEMRKSQPEIFLVFIFMVNICLSLYNFVITNVDLKNNRLTNRNNEIEKKESFVNLYKKYGYYSSSDINIKELKNTNSDTVAWLKVNNTNINYPVVKSNDNKYYSEHSFDKTASSDGWIYMDYRNNSVDLSFNTIIYGKELEDQEGFGDMDYIFSDAYLKNSDKIIQFITHNSAYQFKVFSAYVTDNAGYIVPEFDHVKSYGNFLRAIHTKSIKDFNIGVEEHDKILSLVTVGDKNQVKVVHAKLIS